MLLFRSLALGLLGACFLLLAMRPATTHVVDHVDRVVYRAAPPVATLVDVAMGVPAAQLGSLVHLEAGEHVIAIDDRPVTGDLDAGAVLAQLTSRPAFVDLEIAGGHGGQRRVVLLLH
jgi:hypothetical protein